MPYDHNLVNLLLVPNLCHGGHAFHASHGPKPGNNRAVQAVEAVLRIRTHDLRERHRLP